MKSRGGNGSNDRNIYSSLLVRNISFDCRAEHLKRLFGQYGSIKDVYLPRDYKTGKPQGIGFIEFGNPAEAKEAKVHMDGEVLLGRELSVVFAEQTRKNPSDMRGRDPAKDCLKGPRSPHHSCSPPPPISRSSPPCHSRSPPPLPPPRCGRLGSPKKRKNSSPSPPRGGVGRMGRSPSSRGRRYDSGSCDQDLSATLLVRNLRRDCRLEILRRLFGQYGLIKDIYLPRDHYTRNPKGFGFIEFVNPADAAEAKVHLHGELLLGRELTVVFGESGRKKPSDMRTRGLENDRRRSLRHDSRSPRHSRSPPPRRFSRSPRHSRSPPPRRYSRLPRHSGSPRSRHARSRTRSHEDHSSRSKRRKN